MEKKTMINWEQDFLCEDIQAIVLEGRHCNTVPAAVPAVCVVRFIVLQLILCYIFKEGSRNVCFWLAHASF
jgi:hypothetical protein